MVLQKVKKIILGTVQFGLDYGINNSEGVLQEEKIYSLLDCAFELGVEILDTAESYGNSHSVISRYHKRSKKRFKIITKYSSKIDTYPIDIIERIKYHCLDFDVDNLYSYMFHSFKDFKNEINKDEYILEKIKKSGFVKKVGVSVYNNYEIENLLNYKEIDLIQVSFNLFDNDFVKSKYLKKAKLNNIEIHTRSVFLQGLFFKDDKKLSGNLLSFKDDLKFLNNFILNNHLNKVNLALNYPFSKKYIDNILIGVDNVKQLKENINSLKEPINDEIFKLIDKIKIKNQNLLNPSKWIK